MLNVFKNVCLGFAVVWGAGVVALSASTELGPLGHVVATAPLAAALAVAALARRPHLPRAIAACAVTGVLGVLNVLALLTIGVLFLPTTAALVLVSTLMLVEATPADIAVRTGAARP
jgi:hypothetical protein